MFLNILIVLYKKKPFESETFKSLQKCKHLLRGSCVTYIWDNSPELLSPDEEKDLVENNAELAIQYLTKSGNTSLSEIYNHIIKLCRRDSLLVILDHDTSFDKLYITEIFKATESSENSDINLFLPLILSCNKIFSPSFEYLKLRSVLWKYPRVGRMSVKNMQAINSGMVIRTNYLKDAFPGYDEHLKFYVTDLDFMYKYRSQNKDVYVLDAHLNHILNFYEEDNASKARRFKEQRWGFLYISKKQNPFLYYFQCIRLSYVTLRFCIVYRTMQFI